MLIFCLAVLRCVSSHMLLSRFEETIDFAHQFQELLRILAQWTLASGAAGTLSASFRFSPAANIKHVEANAEKICRNETELCCSEADQANDYAIDRREDPAFPTTPAHQDGRKNRKHAG